MPRGKKKGDRRRGEAGRQHSDEENDTGDSMSITSAFSDGSAENNVAPALDDGVDESASMENFEEKLKDVIDATTVKSAKTRTDALKSLCTAFCKKYIPDFVANRKVTISDSVERCLKKGSGEEKSWAARAMVLLWLQLGANSDSEELFKELRPLLSTVMADPSASSKARAACAEALGIGTFIGGEEIGTIKEVMVALEKVFRGSMKGDSTKTLTPDVYHLHNRALSAWNLLLSICPPSIANAYIESHLSKLNDVLESPDVEIRITAGESIALMYELAWEADEDFEGDDQDELCAQLKQLATDSNKHRAKKDRRVQRSCFRDILGFVENGDWPSEKVKFSAMEQLCLQGWAQKIQYDMFALVLGSGTNIHLAENELLRQIFGLGPPIPTGQPSQRGSKSERHFVNVSAFKARTKARGKCRDKRSAHVSGE